MPRTRPRLVTILRCVLVAVLTLGVGAVAWAGWSSDAQGAAAARTAQLPAADAPTASGVAGGADVAWTAVRVGEVPASGYRVLRRHEESGATVPATGACAGVVTATSCRDTAVEPGTWTFAVRAVLGPWTGPASEPSAPVEVSGEVEASIEVTPREASPGDDVGVSGAGWPAGTEVRVELGSAEVCTLTSADDGRVADTCPVPGLPTGSHAVRAVGGVRVATSGAVVVRPVLRQVSPAVTAGGRLALRPRGFAAGAQLQVTLGERPLGTLTTDSHGQTAAPGQVAVPADLDTGTYVLRVTDPAGGEATGSVDVVTASLQVAPAAAAPGERVSVTGAGWPESEQSVQLLVGTSSLCSLTPDESGSVSGSCTVPDVLGGAREVRASNGVATATTTFDVLASVHPATPSVTAGAPLTLTGRGFAASGQQVSITVGGVTVVPTGSATVGTDGRVSATITVPALDGGSQEITMTEPGGRSATGSVDVIAPRLVLSRHTGAPESTFQVSGSDWPADATVVVHVGSINPCSFIANASGSFGPSTCTVPYLAGGNHPVRASGGGAQVSVPAGFTVVGSVSASPARVAAGQSVTLAAMGLAAGSDVTFTLGGTIVATGRTTTSGQVSSVSATVPDLAPGTHPLQVTDAAGNTATTDLTVFAPTVQLTRHTGAPGSTLQVSGQDWPGGAVVAIHIGDVNPCSFITNATGSFGPSTCTVPWIAAGDYQVRAAGGGVQSVLPTAFTVVGIVSSSPTRVAAGQSVTLAASGLAGTSDVTFTLGGTTVATGRTSTSGQVSSVSATVPDLAAGTHPLQVTDAAGNTATSEITVFAPTLQLTRDSGAPGTTFQISGQDWPAGSVVAFYVGDVNPCSFVVSATGSFGPGTCSVPFVAGGSYPLRATGGGVDLRPQGTFTVVGEVTATPARVTAGQSTTLRASGLAATSDITFSIGGSAVATGRTNTSGQVSSVSATVPALAAGAHPLRVTDAAGNTADAEVTVFAPTVEPSTRSGAPASTFRVSGRDWPAGVNVTIHVGDVNPCTFQTDAAGAFGPGTCTVPNLAGGGYDLRAAGGGPAISAGTFTVVGSATATPARVAPGQTTRLDAVGLAPGSDVTVSLGGADLATGRTDSSGQVRNLAVPLPDLPAGPHELTVTDAAGGTATVTLTVHRVTLVPAVTSGAADSRFRVDGSNWVPGSTVVVSIGGTHSCTTVASAQGVLAASSCQVPQLAPGTYDVRATGGGPTLTLPGAFTILPPG
ncbi:MAG TPA: hypothetical protein VMF51_04145 [Nocardioides sp.]|uniref:hypothetical protein n=1 Tax=Nocardioides sp. TaxID=35761 RepID=UPI002C192FB2|nr:hypothetical protein [Nocardioides sp.]HTW14296.1 hypothetical protein [Nocardioides sp.]